MFKWIVLFLIIIVLIYGAGAAVTGSIEPGQQVYNAAESVKDSNWLEWGE